MALQEMGIDLHSVVDERSAGFVAMGMALKTQRPVALVCTSGTALLNYGPAMAEAYYQNIPLLVLSADRPPELIDRGDGQAIRQIGVFKNFIKGDFNLDTSVVDHSIKEFTLTVWRSLTEPFTGPAHVNIPLTEPLYEPDERELIEFDIELEQPEENIALPDKFREIWEHSERTVILLGQLPPNNRLSHYLELLSQKGVLVLKENTSNCHVETSVQCIDTWLPAAQEEQFEADLLITIGGHLVSKRIKQRLREMKPKNHWFVGKERALDTFFSLTEHIECNPSGFLKSALTWNTKPHALVDEIILTAKEATELGKKFVEKAPYSDLTVVSEILSSLPDNIALHLANSSVVRYAQLFPSRLDIHYLSNRGTAGIDGSLSTALGYAQKDNRLNVLIIGDLSFFYDNNGFWNHLDKSRFVVILINNGGGGIFRYIPGPTKVDAFDTFFEAHHEARAEMLCNAHNVSYTAVNDTESLQKSLKHYLTSPPENGVVLEVFTPRMENAEILKDYFNTIKTSLS
jgi:2-succinyl-5-enolpyruvyl-6-hydroxy-3-cyclohexene-1-carboxylate synthase